MLTPIQKVRAATNMEEIDYNLLMDCLRDYAAPRDVIMRMLRAGELIRVKKGLYVFGKMYAKRLYSLEILANLIYGPSYISCEYALSYYGLIPEAVHEVTCISMNRNKNFDTPVGRFSYRYLHKDKYIVGINRIEITDGISISIASPEKALADMLYKRKETTVELSFLEEILYDDYRIDASELAKLKIGKMQTIAKVYQHKTIALLADAIRGSKT